MPIGPLRRFLGILGLVALAPLAWMVTVGSIDVVDAAARAAITVVAIATLGRAMTFGVDRMAASLERAAVPDASEPVETGQRAST